MSQRQAVSYCPEQVISRRRATGPGADLPPEAIRRTLASITPRPVLKLGCLFIEIHMPRTTRQRAGEVLKSMMLIVKALD